jgi:hypothetical protein
MFLIDNVRIVNEKGAPQAVKGVGREALSSVKPDSKRQFQGMRQLSPGLV